MDYIKTGGKYDISYFKREKFYENPEEIKLKSSKFLYYLISTKAVIKYKTYYIDDKLFKYINSQRIYLTIDNFDYLLDLINYISNNKIVDIDINKLSIEGKFNLLNYGNVINNKFYAYIKHENIPRDPYSDEENYGDYFDTIDKTKTFELIYFTEENGEYKENLIELNFIGKTFYKYSRNLKYTFLNLVDVDLEIKFKLEKNTSKTSKDNSEEKSKKKLYRHPITEKIDSDYTGKALEYSSNEENSYELFLLYDGEFMNGLRHGIGKEYINNVLICTGTYISDNKTGRCKDYKNGKLVFDGEYKKGNRNGIGKEYYETGELLFEGFFSSAFIEEKEGTTFYKNGNIKSKGEYFIRDEFDSYPDKHHDIVIFNNIDGELIYEGVMINNDFEGEGKSYLNNELIYEGIYSNSKYEGYGKLYKNKQLIYKGEFHQGLYSGHGIEYKDNKIIQKGIWENNIFIKKIAEVSEIEEKELCNICLSAKKIYAFIPCGHLVMCKKCITKYKDTKCCICREKATLQKIFF